MRAEAAQETSDDWDESPPRLMVYRGKVVKIRTFPHTSRTACHNPRANAGYDMMLAVRKYRLETGRQSKDLTAWPKLVP